MKAQLMPHPKGFTTKELLMVLVVIGILFSLAIPAFYALKNNTGNQTGLEAPLKKSH